jgi:DMSO/TMAO reductase YedYZ molybdopterin-dependent catalytic subunit
MNHRRILVMISCSFIILVIFLSGCGQKSAALDVTPTSNEPAGRILTLVGPNGGPILTMEQLKQLPSTEGQAGIKSSTGEITIPELFKGVALKDLVAYLNAELDPSMGVTVIAEDGYSMTYSYDQVMNGSFIAYDPATGNELTQHDPLTAIVAYENNGQPLSSTEEGNLRIVVVSPKNNQVVDGHWSVKWVNKVEVTAVGETWTLDLTGAIQSPVTRDSYQSCGAPSCHGSLYTDENGQNWVGVPLWLLVGEVDDADSHSDVAYNRALADSGYSIDIVDADGITVTLDSKVIKEDNQVIVAHLVNDGELPDMYYPLRLVGSNVQNDQMIGQITKMSVNVPPITIPTSTPVPANTGSITINGMVNQETTYSDADLRELEITTITAEGKDGPQNFQGVLLKQLLDKAGIQEGAAKLVFTASDAYTSEVNLAEVLECPKSLLAFMETPGEYMIVLPDMETSTWVKYVVQIEVK